MADETRMLDADLIDGGCGGHFYSSMLGGNECVYTITEFINTAGSGAVALMNAYNLEGNLLDHIPGGALNDHLRDNRAPQSIIDLILAQNPE
ncbi:hypothetical protein HOD38_00750 [archaeon]|jgi:hypothetical protein|nr:hypothetical protein [archaeon]MBT4396774.1 hypothetical protein [archaeon]MBT4441384.1 hypothetical protein [archaeon]